MPTVPPTIALALERFGGAVRARFAGRVQQIVLFGSFARGDAHEESDVDVLVVIDDLTDQERVRVIGLAYEVDSLLDDFVGLSALVYSTEQAARMRTGGRRLFRDIDSEGLSL
jgi:predicted nucleotidyltransferase